MKVYPLVLSILFICIGPALASPAAPSSTHEPVIQHGFHALVFSKTVGFRHDSIPTGIQAIQNLGLAHDFEVTATEDASVFSEQGLAGFDVIIFLNTTGDVLSDDQQEAMEGFLESGKGFVGIHSAADTEYDWGWYEQVVGAFFDNHPAIQQAELFVEDRVHPATAHLPARWDRTDEWYAFRSNPRSDVHVLISLNEDSYSGGTMGEDHPWAWCREISGGRSFYTNGGHTSDSFSEPAFLDHLLGGIEWAAGVMAGDCGASIGANLEKTTLDDATQNPMDLEILANGDVLFLERAGQVRLISNETGITSTALELAVALDNEDGLLGIVLDPGFGENGWIYLFYSPAGTSIQRVSRFTFNGTLLDPSSEVEILQFPVNREDCCHSAGSMAFDSEGNLLIATGDNTNPFDSDGYTPIDDRTDRAARDARRTSGNTIDLRGKILRITPLAGGGYEIPSGNLFAPGTAQTRPEIYVMGVRNPFRLSIDSQTDFLYWGDVGPDAEGDNAGRGPRGYDEWNQARAAGNFGWPFCVADNRAYTDWDFTSQTHSGQFDCSAPTNASAFNTGLSVVPASQPAWIFYPYGLSAQFPALEDGPGRTAISGPIYRQSGQEASNALPSYFQGSYFIGEWARSWLARVIMDDDGGVLKILPFASDFDFLRPIALKMGPDGVFYGIEWGSGFGGNNEDSQVFRIAYEKGTRAPIVRVNTTDLAGPVPLTVTFDASESTDTDPGDFLTYSWDFTNDGQTDDSGESASFTYEQPGDYTAVLSVSDSFDNVVTRSFAIRAGNSLPVVSSLAPVEGSMFSWGDTLRVSVVVSDAEDGSTEDGSIDCSTVETQLFIGHDEHAHPLDVYTGCDLNIATPNGHGAQGDRIFLYLESRYQDQGGSGVSGALGRTETLLYPRVWEAEHIDEQSGIQLEDSDDPTGGRSHLAFIDHGDWVRYESRNLEGITHLTFRVASGGAGGTISLRQGGPQGPVLGRTNVPVTGGWQQFVDVSMAITPTTGVNDLVLLFENASSTSGLFNINRILFEGPGFAPDPAANPWGLEASFFPSADWSGSPILRTDPGISWFWAADAPAPGLSARPFSARWQGRLIAPSSGSLRLFAQSWGTARIVIDGNEVISIGSEGSSPVEDSHLFRVLEGQEMELTVEYADLAGSAGLILSWEGSRLPRRTIQMSDTRLPSSTGTYSTPLDLAPPTELAILDAYPNPFNESLTTRIQCIPGQRVRASLVDLLGRTSALGDVRCGAGRTVDLNTDGAALSPGMYFLTIESDGKRSSRPVIRL